MKRDLTGLRRSVVIVSIAGRARLVLPPAWHFPGLGSSFDACGKASVASELERLARPLRIEADFVNHPGATGSLGVGEACGNKIPDRAGCISESSLVPKP